MPKALIGQATQKPYLKNEKELGHSEKTRWDFTGTPKRKRPCGDSQAQATPQCPVSHCARLNTENPTCPEVGLEIESALNK